MVFKNVAYLTAGICLLIGSHFIERSFNQSSPLSAVLVFFIALCGFGLVMIAVSRWPWERIDNWRR